MLSDKMEMLSPRFLPKNPKFLQAKYTKKIRLYQKF